MNASRRTSLGWLAAGLFAPFTPVRAVFSQENAKPVIDVRIARRRVVAPGGSIRITEGDLAEIHWSSDEAVELHIHGYDIKIQLQPDTPVTTIIDARATGRFPITSHGWGKGGHGHEALTYLEVYPR